MGTELNKDTIVRAYARWVPVYDLVFGEVFKRAWCAAVAAAERTGGRILEVGVGTGILLPFYATANRLVGVDLSEPMLRKAHARVHELGLSHVEGLAVMDAERMAFPDGSFDVIVAQHVITTVPNPEATLDEFGRVLKPGGVIVRSAVSARKRACGASSNDGSRLSRIHSVGGCNSPGRGLSAGVNVRTACS